jgi:hypoxanthine phosphoribosyltransferase
MDLESVRADLDRVLFTGDELRDRVAGLAREIERDYPGGVLLVGVLKGSVMLVADLLRELRVDAQVDFIAVSSYLGTESTGSVTLRKGLSESIRGRDVIIVEDIIDSGLTVGWLLGYFGPLLPASVEVCAMFRKPTAAKVDVAAKYVGFDIADEFIVGYGLDFDGAYRGLDGVGVLAPHVYG